MKAFFSNIWTRILAHKIIAIVVASVLVVGTPCAIVLPIALHEHSYATEWSIDAENHWHDATCKHEEEKSDLAAHTYTNACDTTCDVCGYARTVGAHVYDNACDTSCNVCGATRTITHAHGTTLTAGEATHYYLCSVCGDKKDEAAHVFDKTVASSEYLKAAATATTKAQYYKSCVCGKASATEYFETDKTTGTLANIQDLSKAYDKVELANPTYETNSDGAVTIEWYQGDTKLDAKPQNAGTYKVKVIIAESATYTGISAEKEFTIAKKVLSGLSVDLTYAGTNSFEVPLGAANGILADDVADGIKVCITFASKNVGASVTGAGLDAEDGNNFANYELDLTTCTANIVPKVLTNISMGDATYKGSTNFSFVLSAPHGLVSGETFTLQVTTASKNVGNAVEIASISYTNNNYSIDKSAITLNIVPKVLNVSKTFEYAGSAVAARQLHAPDASLGGVITGDELFIQVLFESGNAGALVLTGEDAPYLDGADCDNYTLGTYSFSIVPKKLRVENLIDQTISKTYDGTNVFTQSLSTTHGILDGDTVSVSFAVIEWDDDGTKDVALIDSDTYEGGRYTARDITLTGESAGNYVVNVDEVDIEQAYTIEILSKAIALGNEGISFTLVTGQKVYEYTLTPAHGIVANETVIMRVEFTNAAVGASVKPAGVKFLVGGTEVVNYHLTSTDNIKLVDTYGSFAVALVLDCDTAHSETMEVRVGQKVYVKMELHEIDTQQEVDTVLSMFSIKARTGSAATFTGETYYNNTTTTYETVTTATAKIAMEDLTCWADGDYFYYVITCVTAGEISIIVE